MQNYTGLSFFNGSPLALGRFSQLQCHLMGLGHIISSFEAWHYTLSLNGPLSVSKKRDSKQKLASIQEKSIDIQVAVKRRGCKKRSSFTIFTVHYMHQ